MPFTVFKEVLEFGDEASIELVEGHVGALVLVFQEQIHLFQAHSVAPQGSRGVVGADARGHLGIVVIQHLHDGFGRRDFIQKSIFQQLHRHGLVAAE